MPVPGSGGSLSDDSGPLFGSGLIEEATASSQPTNSAAEDKRGSAQAVKRQTPCGAIPDTGSTAIMCPKEQCMALFEGICAKWDRCANFSKRLGSLAHQWLKISNEWSNLTDIPMEALSAAIRPNLNALLLHVEEEQLRGGEIRSLEASNFLQISDHQSRQPIGHASVVQADHGESEETMPAAVTTMLATSAFMSLLDNCQEWKNASGSKGLDEMPPVSFFLKGEEGKANKFDISAYAYVNELQVENVSEMKQTASEARSNLEGAMPSEIMNRAAGKKTVCTPAFGGMSMNTADHGPLWILGQPLFYQYDVNFDRSKRTIALQPQSACTTCAGGGGQQTGATPSSFAEQSNRPGPRRPRVVMGAPRLPNIKHVDGVVHL
jgi:hypothetical protein